MSASPPDLGAPRWGAISYPGYRRYWPASVARVFGMTFRFIGAGWLAETPPSAAELAAAKEATLGAQAMDRQRAHDRAAELGLWERYGVPAPSARAALDSALHAVTPDQAAGEPA